MELTFGQLLARPWRKLVDFHGRASRREYWLFVMQLFVATFACWILIFILFGQVPLRGRAGVASVMLILLGLFLLFASTSAAIRRMHDQDRSGWFVLLFFLPLIGWLIWAVLMLLPGSKGRNGFGFDPRYGDKARGAETAEIFG
jgi:uncharacterized membrane protein YhaH (DUF805 family)